MTRLTCATVNAELKKLGIAERLVKGKGYYYFAEGEAHTWPATSVYVFHISQFTLEQWLEQHASLKADAERSGWC